MNPTKLFGMEVNFVGFMVFCGIGFFAGMCYEAVSTLKVTNEFTAYKLAASEDLVKAQNEARDARNQADNDLLVAGIVNEKAISSITGQRNNAIGRLRDYEAAAASAVESSSDSCPPEVASAPKLLSRMGEAATGIIAECEQVRQDYILARTYIDSVQKVCR